MLDDSIKELLEQLKNIIHLAKEGKLSSQELPKDFEERLKLAEAYGKAVLQVESTSLRQLNVSEEAIQEAITHPRFSSAEERSLLEQLQKMQQEIQLLRQRFKAAANLYKQKEKNRGKKGYGEVRKKKFRRLGGKDSWTPL